MPSLRTHRKGNEEKNRVIKSKLPEKSMSFHGQSSGSSSSSSTSELLRRPRTVPDLLSGCRNSFGDSPAVSFRPTKLTKLLVNVTIQRSCGSVQVLISLDSRVEDLVAAAIKQYTKEGRRPVLSSVSAGDYDLHYSQFSLESLDRKEKLTALGSRNFFLCPRNGVVATSSSSCGKEADAANKIAVSWLKFMDFLL